MIGRVEFQVGTLGKTGQDVAPIHETTSVVAAAARGSLRSDMRLVLLEGRWE